MVADGVNRGSRTHQGSPVSRAELELAVRAQLVDFGATGWHARVTADYILGVVDDYVQARGECFEKRLEEILESHLGAATTGEHRRNPDLTRWIMEDSHCALHQGLPLRPGRTPGEDDFQRRRPGESG